MNDDDTGVTNEESVVVDGGEASEGEAEETNFEEEARYQGWVPKEEFRGPYDMWLPAEDFVRKGKEINPILRANNERLKQSLSALERQNQIYAEEIKALREGQQGINLRDFETTLELKNRQRMVAMKAGDEDLFLQLDREITNLLLSKGELIEGRKTQNGADRLKETPAGNVDPVFQGWVNDNNWYGQDEFRTIAVNRVAEEMRERYPNLVGRAFLDAVLRGATKRYPEDFGASYTSGRRVIGDIGEPSAVIQHSKGKGAKDLPADAKVEMARFVKEKQGTEADYIRLYFEE